MENNLNLDEKIKLNTRKILCGQLAIEDYLDMQYIKKDPENVSIAFKKIKNYRQVKTALSKEDLLKLTNEVCDALEKAYDELGRENFTFYEDGDVNYNG